MAGQLNHIKPSEISFIVRTGNWKVCVKLKPQNKTISESDFIEASTMAIESCFGNEELKNCEILQLFNDSGQNYFSKKYNGDLSEIPEFLFGVLLVCYIETDEHNKEKWKYFVLSDIFANASQPDNYKLAVEFEKKWNKYIEKLQERQKNLIINIKSKRKQLKKVEKKVKK